MLSKGDRTRLSILEEALAQATKVGFEGLSLGDLAKDAGMSKSGLYAHFASKEDLQLQILKMAAERFIASVIQPAWGRPKGEARVRALFQLWFDWSRSSFLPGGCIFVSAANEMDDRPGPVRDHLVAEQRRWLATIARAFFSGIEAGQFRPDLDCDQAAYEMEGIILAYHQFNRLLRSSEAEDRAKRAFESLIEKSRNR